MSSLPIDTRLNALVSEAVANYGQYTGDVTGLGHGRVDRVLEVPVVPTADWEHAYTTTPMINAYKLACGGAARVRSFVYVIPLEVRDGREQRMRVGSDGEDLDIATFFRPVGLDARKGDVYVAMPTKAFAREGDDVQYAFRVRNYVEMRDGTLFALDTLQIGMELATSAQKKHARRGVMLVTNERMFSFQLGEEGDKQAGFRMQYAAEGSMADAAPEDSKAVLYTQAFGFVARPPSAEERLTRFLRSHFHLCPRVQTKSMGATRGGATRGGGGSSLSFGKALAGEARQVNVTASAAEPIAERATVELCLAVGDVARVFHEKHVEAGAAVVADAVVVAATTTEEISGFSEVMRCLARMLIAADSNRGEDAITQKKELRQAIDDLRAWPTLKVHGPLGALAPSNLAALAVGVVECEDRDDEEGQGLSKTSGDNAARVYTVRVGTLIRVRLTNFSLGGEYMKVRPVYFNAIQDSGATLYVEEEEAAVVLEPGDTYELPYPIQMEPGEDENGWMLKDGDGRTVLKISFVLDAEDNARFRARLEIEARENVQREAERVEREKAQAEREKAQAERDAMLVDADGARPALECVVCMEKKTISELPALVPCGHAVCCFPCFQRKIEVDTAKGLRSTCPLCRAVVQTAMRVYF